MGKVKDVKRPVSHGVVSVPAVMQLETLECGAACLTMILAYYGKWIPLEQVRIDCGVSRDGSKAVNILKAARKYGLTAKGYRYEPGTLREKGTFPCIVHWNMDHFVVLDGFRGDRVYLNDPAKGAYSVSAEAFDEAFTGVCLMFAPSESFEPSGRRKSVIEFASKRMDGLRIPLFLTVLSSALVSVIGVIEPVLNRIFYDRLLTGRNPEWFMPFVIGLASLYAAQVVVATVSAAVNMRINGKINIVGNLSFMWKVLHLPMNFFSQRMTGDILSRQDSNAAVANTLVDVLSPLVMNSAMMIFYLTVMIRYSWILTLIGIGGAIVNLAFSQYISHRRVNLARVQSRDEGKLASATVAGVQMIETIKSSGAEDGFFQKWSGNFAADNATRQKFARENQVLNIIPSVVSAVAGSLILGAGVYMTMTGKFTLGSIVAFQGFFEAFMSPALQFITVGQTVQEMRTQMERIDDVMEYPADPNIKDIPPADGQPCEKLSGDIEIKNLTFGYSPLDEPLIKNFNMSIKRGSSVAFVGPSGCGKSTLSKLISGLYVPQGGEILFDGKRVDRIDHRIFTASLAVVDQDIFIFEDTIENNIKMWDDSIEDFEMILAAKDAQLHYDIVARPNGYRYKLTEGGRDLSGGQKQRLEIARVLAQEPNIIILDEATSALDAKTEYEVVKAIEARGITCIVIAHRLSTIRDCEQIVVLDKGEVVERGTHEELMALGGHYTRLITNE